jgi:hypothetical protein
MAAELKGDPTNGPAAPGRADQITASAMLLNGSQMVMLNQATARRMDVEAARTQVELRRGYLKTLSTYSPKVNP